MKKIANIIAAYFFYSTQNYYNKYFYNNIKLSYKKIVAQKFWDYTYIKTELVFNKVLKEIKKICKDIAEYIFILFQDWWIP